MSSNGTSYPTPWEVNPIILNTFGTLGTLSAVVLWSVPFRDVFLLKSSVFRAKTTRNLGTAFNYIAALANCALWVLYTATRISSLMAAFVVNVAGVVLNLALVVTFGYYSQETQRKWFLVQSGLCFVPVLLCGLIWAGTGSNDFIGYVVIVFNTLMYYGPLQAAFRVCKTQNVHGMPLPPLVMTLVTSLLWGVYGTYALEIPIMVPNYMGIVFGIVQLSIWFWAWCGTNTEDTPPTSNHQDSPPNQQPKDQTLSAV